MAAILFLAAAAPAIAGSVSITSPSNGQSVTSPVRVVASASDADGVKLMKIWLDGKAVYEVRAAKLDTSIAAATGTRRLTVQGYDNAGTSFSKSIYVTVSSSSSSSGGTTGKVYSNIEQMDGWGSCTECAGGGEGAKYSMTRGQSSPSIDGNSTKFWIGGTTSYSHGLWWRRMSSDTSSTNFVLELSVYMKEPSKSHGLEFAANQSKDDKWYKFSTQCSFGSNEWRVWDSRYSTWRGTGIACPRPKAYTWTNYRFEYKREDGKAKFISITVNGSKKYVNRAFYPQLKDSSGSVGIHYQMNGNKYQDDYTSWVDKMKLTVW